MSCLISSIVEWPGLEFRFLQVISVLVHHHTKLDSITYPQNTFLLSEKSQVMEWSKGKIKPQCTKYLHVLFENQVKKQPHAIALLDKAGSMGRTYAVGDTQMTMLVNMGMHTQLLVESGIISELYFPRLT